MVFTLIADIVLETTIWTLKRSYEIGYYLIYGHQETTEEKLLKTIEEMKIQREEDMRKDMEKIKKIEEIIKLNTKYMMILENKTQSDKNK